MDENHYIFKIDAFTPDTLPMARLAEYMKALSNLLDHKNSVHFSHVAPGSAELNYKVDSPDMPKIRKRLMVAQSDDKPKDIQKAWSELDDLLAEDNAIGEMLDQDRSVIIPFPGREREKPLILPNITQDGSLDGQIISIGGKDKTAHAILQDGERVYTGFSIKRELAKDLAQYLYGSRIRLFGTGRWEREPSGSWKLLNFNVSSFEALNSRNLVEDILAIQEFTDGTQNKDVLGELNEYRAEEVDNH